MAKHKSEPDTLAPEKASSPPEAAPAVLPSIKLKNRTRRPERLVTVNLPHEYACKRSCRCQKTTIAISELDPRTGVKGIRETRRGIPSSLTLCAGEISEEFPPEVADAPEVRAAIDRGELAVLQ